MEIQVRIHSEGALRNQRYAFTDRFTLVSELLQNARRAGATLIEVSHDEPSRTLRVRDNGRGLDDFQKLLTIHDSGWDIDLQQQEHAFGVGFSKCLYASTRCIVSSNGLEADIDTASALQRLPIPVQQRSSDAREEPGTVIELYGVDLPGLSKRIGQMCRGFPVPVEFNGQILARPDGAGSRDFHDTAIGAVRLSGMVDGQCSSYIRIYLQGFCVHQRPTHFNADDAANVVHLDPARFLARLPDRDKLIDEDEQVKVVGREIALLWRQILENRKAALPARQFVETFYAAMRMWDHLDMLDDVDVLPREVCAAITGYPIQEPFSNGSFVESVISAPTREEVESGHIRLVQLDAPSGESMAHWMVARAQDMVLIDAHLLSERHWVHAHVRDLATEDISVQATGAPLRTRLEGRWMWINVVLCGRVRIQVGSDCVELEEDGVFHEDTLFIPAGEHSGCAVQQASDFMDSCDRFHEDDMEADSAALAELIHRMRAVDPVLTLRSMLEQLNLERFPLMIGRSFRLSIGAIPQDHRLEMLD